MQHSGPAPDDPFLTGSQHRNPEHLDAAAMLALGLAHDLNNVLTPVLMGAELLDRLYPDPNARTLLDAIQGGARRATELVDQVLAVARAEPWQGQPVSLRGLLDELEHHGTQVLAPSVGLRIAVAPEELVVSGSRTQLVQVLLNVVQNAVDAMSGSGTITVTVAADQVGRQAAIHLANTGPSISPDVLACIFEPMFTTKRATTRIGLGLAGARAIARLHGGDLTATSPAAEGVTFTLTLPLAAAPSTAAANAVARVAEELSS